MREMIIEMETNSFFYRYFYRCTPLFVLNDIDPRCHLFQFLLVFAGVQKLIQIYT